MRPDVGWMSFFRMGGSSREQGSEERPSPEVNSLMPGGFRRRRAKRGYSPAFFFGPPTPAFSGPIAKVRATTNGGPPPSPAATPASFRSPPLYSPPSAVDRDARSISPRGEESPGKAEETTGCRRRRSSSFRRRVRTGRGRPRPRSSTAPGSPAVTRQTSRC